jgi:glycosyltransferase involved in cell wall biosynthesis
MENRTQLPPSKLRATPSRLPVISMVTCSFQQGRYLEQALRSVLDQGYPRLEYIVIDGGSTDESVEIIKRHQSALAYWISEPDGGQTDALIKGFARASGEICGWLCSDDMLLPGALQAVGDFFASNPGAMAVYGDALWIDAAGRPLRPKKEIAFNRFVLLHDHNYIPQPSMFWRRSLYEAVKGLDPQFDLAMDADLWERFSARAPIAHMSRYLSCMRFYPEQKTRSRKAEGRGEDRSIRQRDDTFAARGFTAPMLRFLARCVRVSAKAVAGGYTARVPMEQRAWLERYGTSGVRK